MDTGDRPPTRLLLADDHPMIREALHRAMTDAGIAVVGAARDGAEAVRLAGELLPDLVLMDVSMPGLDGVAATRQIHEVHPEIGIIMLTMHADVDTVRSALAAGAIGYLVKDGAMSEIVDMVKVAADGETCMSVEVAASMLTEVRRLERQGHPNAQVAEQQVITKREVEVLQLIAEGLSTPEVAAKLYISLKTVKNHLASIYAKLDSRDRTQAVVRAVRMGIIRIE